MIDVERGHSPDWQDEAAKLAERINAMVTWDRQIDVSIHHDAVYDGHVLELRLNAQNVDFGVHLRLTGIEQRDILRVYVLGAFHKVVCFMFTRKGNDD